MPLHAVALELLKETGPLAVSSANRTGLPAATTSAAARGAARRRPCPSTWTVARAVNDVPSTIVDLTGNVPRLLRAGAVSLGRLREVAACPRPTTFGQTPDGSRRHAAIARLSSWLLCTLARR